MAGADYESILCVKNEVFIYRIPPRTTSRGYRAADWKLENPDWTGRMRICAKGKACYVKIEDKVSGELFAKCNVDDYPGIAVEGVLDSSRYFVLKIEDADTGRHAFIGLGFSDRGDAFDFNVALQDHFKWVKKSEEIEAEKNFPQPEQPKLDLAFKQGQTIHINIGNKSTSKPRAAGSTSGLLPPPPGSGAQPPKLAPPPSGSGSASPLSSRKVQQTQPQPAGSSDLFSTFSEFGPSTQTQQPASNANEWGDFTSASQGSNNSGGGWVQF